MNKKGGFRKLILSAQSALSWMSHYPVPIPQTIKGLDLELLCLPDSAKWNRFSNYPFLHFLFREPYFRGMVREIKKGGEKRKVILIIHKKRLLMPVLAVARTLLRARAVDDSTLRVLIMNLNGQQSTDKPLSPQEVAHACLQYGVSESIIADSRFDPRTNPDKEVHRFFSSY
jgi:hypothetical protein